MLKNIVVQLYFFLSYLVGIGQTIPSEKVAPLPDDLTECSGMVALHDNAIALVNDGGNAPELFIVDTTGKLIHKSEIPGVENIDWESLAFADGILYIGDFGNNRNKRKDLKIYRLEMSDFLTLGKMKVLEPILFSYADQDGFPPQGPHRNYDLEAMVLLNDSIFLFTKNRTEPFDGYSHCYGLSIRAETQKAERLQSYKAGNGLTESFWISGAGFSIKYHQLVLTGYDKLWIFKDFEGSDFFGGTSQMYYYNRFSQKEGICVIGDKIYYTDEKNNDITGFLYKSTYSVFPKPYTLENKKANSD